MNEIPVGVEWPDQKERFARLRESVTLIHQLFEEEFVTFEGEYYRTHNATIYDKPDEPVPIYIAASGPAAARLAGRVGDGFICTSGKGQELYTETLMPAFNEACIKVDRDPTLIDRMIEMKVSFDTDRARAMEDTKVWSALALSGEQKMGVDDPREMERARQGGRGRRLQALAGLGRPGRARRADRGLRRLRLRPPRVPFPGRGPGGRHRTLRRADPAAACASGSA